MLLLTRRVGETIVINGDTTVTLLEIRNKQVRIGVTAPREVLVLRGELDARDREKKS